MTVDVPIRLVSHARRVCSLYKNALRNIENFAYLKHIYRYHAVLMRKRFDDNAKIRDLRIAKQMVIDGEKELFESMHPQPRSFADSPGGMAYGRTVVPPDWVVDYWHPSEKAAYPEYFARRELRKKEYIEWYKKTYPDVAKKIQSSQH
ncbi:NADH dehydrogenase [ubiquinone] 1 beta subcomplex subunit 9 [Athalia rosae]|uniref:NADH dehydrogenase [ubiquinone] 1 beta subcomplex subunit 9 n=1 Tax=Athalia rosae TaxID=37344 RepID=UPI00203443CE|nr:NADH dehydrogenase [ubiquinone] 1 beta subcomplex subunit 9 [Athalia rosae]